MTTNRHTRVAALCCALSITVTAALGLPSAVAAPESPSGESATFAHATETDPHALDSAVDVSETATTDGDNTTLDTPQSQPAKSPEAAVATDSATDSATPHSHSADEHTDHASATPSAHTPHPAWTPGQYDTCPATLHDSYRVVGTDGQVYEGWHPAVVTDPESGKTCTFGHEHGDDPRTSVIYDWAVRQLSQDGTGIPMGQVNAASVAYSEAQNQAVAHRHEDHVGSKIFVANNVTRLLSDRSGYELGADGQPLTCSYLIEFHQGSHSKDALSNNAHQLVYAFRCSDGTEAAVQLLTPMGHANEYTEKCSGKTVATSGSLLPDGVGGQRIIPDSDCASQALLNRPEDVWSMYEVWQTDSVVALPGDGQLRIDPWFGVRNPGRVAKAGANEAVSTQSLTEANLDSFLWLRREGVSAGAPSSQWTGHARDFYLSQTVVEGAAGLPTDGVFYTDPYGGHASTKPFPGAVRQYVAKRDWAPAQDVERWSSGFATIYGAGSVHTPN